MLEAYVEKWPAAHIENFGTQPDQPAHRFRLQGLDPNSRYRIKFQDRGDAADQVLAGQFLMRAGVEVTLPLPLSSELIFVEEIS
jgi:hypothetical protein